MVPVEQRWSSLRNMSFYPSGLAAVVPAAYARPMKSIVFFYHVCMPAAVGRIRTTLLQPCLSLWVFYNSNYNNAKNQEVVSERI